jgi:hypothetical protein
VVWKTSIILAWKSRWWSLRNECVGMKQLTERMKRVPASTPVWVEYKLSLLYKHKVKLKTCTLHFSLYILSKRNDTAGQFNHYYTVCVEIFAGFKFSRSSWWHSIREFMFSANILYTSNFLIVISSCIYRTMYISVFTVAISLVSLAL